MILRPLHQAIQTTRPSRARASIELAAFWRLRRVPADHDSDEPKTSILRADVALCWKYDGDLARARGPTDDSSVEIAALDTRGRDADGHPSLVRRTKRIGVLAEVLLRQAVDLLVRALVDERRSPAH